MRCPRCNSDKIAIISTTYPNVYLCESCGTVFADLPNPLIDEGV